MRLARTLLVVLGVALPGHLAAEEALPAGTLYKTPGCHCCGAYAAYLREHGLELEVVPTHDLPLIQHRHGVPEGFEGCHSMLIGGYVVEGHVPVATVLRLLSERPAVKGISLPGMPLGSPGMTGEKGEPFVIYGFGDGPPEVYAVD